MATPTRTTEARRSVSWSSHGGYAEVSPGLYAPWFAARDEKRMFGGQDRSYLVPQRRLGWSAPVGWLGDTRIEADTYVQEQWLEMMTDLQDVNAGDEPFSLIRFE